MKFARVVFSASLFVFAACQGDSPSGPGGGQVPAPTPGDAGPIVTECGAREESFENLGGGHVNGDLVYEDPPPVTGNHNPFWARWGVHTEPVPDECFVHNMEHGGVVFLYNCPEGCAAEVEELSKFVEGRPFALLTSYETMPSKFAVVSWGHRLTSDCFDLEAFEDFFTAHKEQGPEHIASNPPTECQGGS